MDYARAKGLNKACRVVLMGDVSVGKTTLIYRIIEDQFNSRVIPTTSAAVFHYSQTNSDYPDIEFWDTAGMERYRSLNTSFVRDAVAALILFDLSSRQSFDSVEGWINEFISKSGPEKLILLVGNKNDTNSAVLPGQISALSERYHIEYVSVSAKTGAGVSLLLEILSQRLPKEKKEANITFIDDEQPQKRCC